MSGGGGVTVCQAAEWKGSACEAQKGYLGVVCAAGYYVECT